MMPQTLAQYDAKQIAYIEKCRTRAAEKHLAVIGATHKATGRRIALVASQSEPGKWHRVISVGNRLLCDCKAMYSPPVIDQDGTVIAEGAYDRWPSCIHAQTVYLHTLALKDSDSGAA